MFLAFLFQFIWERKGKGDKTIEEWPTTSPISVCDFLMQDTSMWNQVYMGEGSKGPIISYVKIFRVYVLKKLKMKK